MYIFMKTDFVFLIHTHTHTHTHTHIYIYIYIYIFQRIISNFSPGIHIYCEIRVDFLSIYRYRLIYYALVWRDTHFVHLGRKFNSVNVFHYLNQHIRVFSIFTLVTSMLTGLAEAARGQSSRTKGGSSDNHAGSAPRLDPPLTTLLILPILIVLQLASFCVRWPISGANFETVFQTRFWRAKGPWILNVFLPGICF